MGTKIYKANINEELRWKPNNRQSQPSIATNVFSSPLYKLASSVTKHPPNSFTFLQPFTRSSHMTQDDWKNWLWVFYVFVFSSSFGCNFSTHRDSTLLLAQSAGVVECIDCISAEDHVPNKYAVYGTKQSDGEVPVMLKHGVPLHSNCSQVHCGTKWKLMKWSNLWLR